MNSLKGTAVIIGLMVKYYYICYAARWDLIIKKTAQHIYTEDEVYSFVVKCYLYCFIAIEIGVLHTLQCVWVII